MTTERLTLDRLNQFRMQRRNLEAQGLRMEEHLAEMHDEVEIARRVEQEQAEKIRALEEKLALVMGERDAAETKAAHLEARLTVAHESIGVAHDSVAEQVRQARWEVATEALEASTQTMYAYLRAVRDANAPKD